MKVLKFVLIICFVFLSIQESYASPLIFKATKEITNTGITEICRIDTGKYKQIRIAIKHINKRNEDSQPLISRKDIVKLQLNKDLAQVELNSAKRELQRSKELLSSGVISKTDYDSSADRLKATQEIFNSAEQKLKTAQETFDKTTEEKLNQNGFTNIFGIEGDEEFLLANFATHNSEKSLVIDVPPSAVSVKVSIKGIYKVFVWAN